tara:strand:- start:293 stop:511 length:219 start_codon:yes stop_codon:yes gene_type:complete
MDEIVVKIPDELKFVKQTSNIDWSILVGKLIKSKLDEIVELQRGLSKSKLTEKDVQEFSDKINESLSKRYLE